jgi:hypothetical protein
MILKSDNFIKLYVCEKKRERKQVSQNIALNDEVLLLETLI